MKKLVRIAILVRRNYWLNDNVPGNNSGHRSVPDICTAVKKAGGAPHLVYQQQRGDFDALILPGGGDVHPQFYGQSLGVGMDEASLNPALDEFQLNWASKALQSGLPVLGICRGMQVLNVAAGGTLIQDIPSSLQALDHAPRAVLADPRLRRQSVHALRLETGSQLALALGEAPIDVNSIHHQAVDVLGRGLRATAWAEDGIVEALEASRQQVGVQFHPEDLQHRPAFQRIFDKLVADARG